MDNFISILYNEIFIGCTKTETLILYQVVDFVFMTLSHMIPSTIDFILYKINALTEKVFLLILRPKTHHWL